MREHRHFFEIVLKGESIGTSRIPVNQLLLLLSELKKVLNRVGRVLQGQGESVRRGPTQKSIKDEISLDLVELTHGSPDTVLGFERPSGQQAFDGLDFGVEILERALKGLMEVQEEGEELPAGFDSGVLIACRDLGTLFEKGVSEIQFFLNHRPQPLGASYNPNGYGKIQERIHGPQVNIRTIEGRLLMADFKEHGTRCRVHPSVGDPVLCLFDEERKEEILENMLRYVKIIGEAKEDPITDKITSIVLHDIQRFEDREQERTDLLPQGTPLPSDFWQSLSIEELAQAQGVQPLSDVSVLFGTWPGEPDDGFEEEVRKLRQQSLTTG